MTFEESSVLHTLQYNQVKIAVTPMTFAVGFLDIAVFLASL